MINATVTTAGAEEHESDDAKWGALVDELRAGAEEQMRSNIRASSQMTNTKQTYEDATSFTPIEDGIRISVGTAGAFSLAEAQERGQRPWHEAPKFVVGTGGARSGRPPNRGTVFRTVTYQGKRRVIPLDAGYPAKSGGAWDHPGLPKLGLLALTKQEVLKNLLPRLYARYRGGAE